MYTLLYGCQCLLYSGRYDSALDLLYAVLYDPRPMDVTNEPPGARLKRRRKELDLSMAELASAAKVKKPSIQAYEAGVSPNIAAAQRIARVLGVSILDVWGDDLDAAADDASPGDDVDVRAALRLARTLGVTVESIWPVDAAIKAAPTEDAGDDADDAAGGSA